MQEKDGKYQAPALDKGLDILEYLSSQSVPQSQTEIASGIDRSANEIYRMLVCLENRGYILRDEISGKYRLSLKIYHLSHRHSPVDELRKAAQYPMDELSQTIRQSCHLSILYMNQVMVVIHAKSPGPIAISIEEGNIFPLPLTASGRVLLAYMSEQEKQTVLNGNKIFRDFTGKQQKQFLSSLEQIRKNGYYIVASDLAEGVVDIGVPVGNSSIGTVACLTVPRLSTLNIDKGIDNDRILAEAKKCAKSIQNRIGMENK